MPLVLASRLTRSISNHHGMGSLLLLVGLIESPLWLPVIAQPPPHELYEYMTPADTAECLEKVRYGTFKATAKK